MELHGHVSGDHHPTFLDDVVPAFRLRERMKRLLDIVAAIAGLILFAPILLVTSIAIKLDSRGPIFVRELYGGIQVITFRFEAACAASDRSSPPLTRVGRILSQTGIDELPQLLNVLRGEMSIVGRQNVHRWPASTH